MRNDDTLGAFTPASQVKQSEMRRVMQYAPTKGFENSKA